MDKFEKELRKKLKDEPVVIKRHGAHVVVYDLSGRRISGLSDHTADARVSGCAEQNFASQLRRAGINFPRKKQGRKKS